MSAPVLDGPTAPGGIAPRRRHRVRAAVARVSLGALVAVGAGLAVRSVSGTRDVRSAPGSISAAALEDRYGVRIDLVGLEALGGLIVLKFTVLDKDKAEVLFHDKKPDLLVEKDGSVLHPPVDSAHKMVLLNGASYFLMYANAGNVVHGDDKVSVVVDQLRLEHQIVQR